MLVAQGPAVRAIGSELLQTRKGSVEYVAAMARLRLRNPAQDARRDLAEGNRDLYCVGTIGCWPPGVSEDIPVGFSVRATATAGCIIMGGDIELAYRDEEERYVAIYNQAKLTAFRGTRGRERATSWTAQ
jgi:hypothetical protein